jgi:hypothetical protein
MSYSGMSFLLFGGAVGMNLFLLLLVSRTRSGSLASIVEIKLKEDQESCEIMPMNGKMMTTKLSQMQVFTCYPTLNRLLININVGTKIITMNLMVKDFERQANIEALYGILNEDVFKVQ